MTSDADTVLIVTASYDEAPCYVHRRIEERGARVFRLDTDRFPASVRASLQEDGTFQLSDGDQTLASSAIRSVWYRRHVDPDSPPGIEPQFVEFGTRESRALVAGTLLGLRKVNWMSHPAALWAAEKKPYQMSVASSLGFTLPETRVTNDACVARDFAESRTLVAKAVSSGYLHAEDGYDAIFTSIVRDCDLQDLGGLSLAPVTFQEWIPKRSDIRVTVVGRTVFATEILSQGQDSSRIDWRATDTPDLPHRRFELPAVDAKRCIDLVASLGLTFAAIDLVLDDRGALLFLEVNPNGEWMWIEDLVGYPISSSIADVLTA